MPSSRGLKLAAPSSEPVPAGAYRRYETDEHPIGEAARLIAAENAVDRDELLAMLAHELRNPLAPIRTAVQVFREVELYDARLERARDTIERQIDRLARLVDELVEVAGLMRGLTELQRERVAIAEVVQGALDVCRASIEAQEHALEVDLGREPLFVEGDPLRLKQALASLLDNAAKYTERGGSIAIGARRGGDRVLLSVKDSGVGMPAELIPRVFELFEQGRRGLDRSQGGLGLGLPLVRRLVEMQGGWVDAHSDGPDQGSVFTIALPLARAERPAVIAQPAIRITSAPAGRYRVLVVDDNVDAAESLQLLLELWGHEVRCAHDAHEALTLTARFAPDLALLDIGLPVMDGYELARRLRSMPSFSGTTLVALTGYGGDEDRRKAREAGFDRHITKPATPATLRGLLAAEDKRRAARRDAD